MRRPLRGAGTAHPPPAMRLRRLETFGFKSFADRTVLDFEDGVTAIIGPNGCGKSNVVDAIKWVIGEQSAKALRGDDMTDVIFNGCATRRGMPYAEVTLTLDQVGLSLGVDADEVAITRRLTRDGTSSYYLNGKSCRLKDIKELFLGTGMGTSAYAVIEQGRVGFILESNTKDRRLILEEAAGISRYRARKKIAERKLERVRLDLQRIAEILAEVTRRAKAIARQAAAALRWRELTAQAKQLRLASALEEFGRLSAVLAECAADIAAAQDLEGSSAARLAEIEAALAGSDLRLGEIETTLRALEQERATAVSRRDVAASRGRDAGAQLPELDRQEADDRAQLAALAQQTATIGAELAVAEQAAAAAEHLPESDQPADDRVTGIRQRLDAAIDEVDALLAKAEDIKGRRIEAMREISRVQASAHALDAARSGVGERRKRLEERSGGQASALDEAKRAEIAARAEVEQAMRTAADVHIALDDAAKAREESLAESERLERELNEIRHNEARTETHLRLLTEQERRAEGVGRGPRDVLQAGERLRGIVGLVAELCQVDPEHIIAIETAMGQQATNVVVETQSDAKAAIEFLKQEKRGRATFLPIDDVRGEERVEREILREPGVVGIASRLVRFEPHLRAIYEHVLGNICVVETLDHALNIRRRVRHHGCRFVTLDGEVVASSGAMTGGRQNHDAGGGLVSRKADMRRCEDELRQSSERRAALTARRDRAREQAAAATAAVDAKRREIQIADRAAADARSRLVAAERDRLHREEGASGYGAELEEIGAELARLDQEAKETAGQESWFTALDAKLVQDLASAEGAMDIAEAARDRLQQEWASLQVEAAAAHERRTAARNQAASLRRTLAGLEDQRQERERRLSGVAERRGDLQRLVEASAAQQRDAAEEVEQLAARMNAAVAERDGIRLATEEQRQEGRVLAARRRAAETGRAAAETRQAEVRVRLENITARMVEDYQIDLADAFTRYERPDDLDLDRVQRELAEAEAELAKLGPVNLAAIDELDEVQERQRFLERQHGDLQSAADKLQAIIEQVDQVSRRLFDETYTAVRKHFQELFVKLFGGGSADLKLERWEMVTITGDDGAPREVRREVDVLDAGLEIVARPPGKNPAIITQLSGGEKALTAIALLFAVYQTKPSPFCILDEVDAPLDDANVDVYNSMLRDFTRAAAADATLAGDGRQGSQFIVITHKKRTMQRADALFGVTQNEPGVSTTVSVRFDEVEKLGSGPQQTARGSGPFALA